MAWIVSTPVVTVQSAGNFLIEVGLVSDADALVGEDLFDHFTAIQKEMLQGKYINSISTTPDAVDIPEGVYTVDLENDAGVVLALTGRLIDTKEVEATLDNSTPKIVMAVYEALLLSLSTLGATKKTLITLECIETAPEAVV